MKGTGKPKEQIRERDYASMGTTWASDRENEGDEHYIRTPKDKPRTDASGLVGGSAPLSSAKHIASLNKSPNLMNNPSQQTNIFEAVPVSPDPFIKPKVKRVNSTSTIYAKSTIGKPDITEIVECMAITVFWQIKQSELQLDTGFNEVFSIQNKNAPFPSIAVIEEFLKKVWKSQSLSAECGVMAMAYLDRLITLTGIQIRPGNWKKIVLGAVVLASKDCAVWNEDFLGVLAGEFTIRDLNQMEHQFLSCLQFAVTLKASVYAKYYFNLRSVCKDESQFSVKPLTEEAATNLKIRSKQFETEWKTKALEKKPHPLFKSESHDSYQRTSPPVVLN